MVVLTAELHHSKIVLNRIVEILTAHAWFDVEIVAIVANLQQQVARLTAAEGAFYRLVVHFD